MPLGCQVETPKSTVREGRTGSSISHIAIEPGRHSRHPRSPERLAAQAAGPKVLAPTSRLLDIGHTQRSAASRHAARRVMAGLVPAIPIGKVRRFTASGSPGLIPGSSPGTVMTRRGGQDRWGPPRGWQGRPDPVFQASHPTGLIPRSRAAASRRRIQRARDPPGYLAAAPPEAGRTGERRRPGRGLGPVSKEVQENRARPVI